MLSYVLIIDKRKELSVKYKKSIDDEQTSAVIARTLKDAVALVQESEPDLIIISDSIDEDLSNFCEKMRTLTYNTRPTIIALSKSADTADRIKVLASGADDFLSEPVNIEEFKMRIKAHLRRDIESNLNNVTLLPNKKYVYKAIRRLLHSENKLAILLAGIENLKNNVDTLIVIPNDIAGDKLLQTFAAITKSALDANDFLGQLDDKNFVIITNPYSAEKMAAFLTFAFDTVTPKFYSEQDVRRGYTLLDGDRKAGMRANFVSVLIGGILDNYESISGVDGLLEKLFAIKKIARIPSGSNYAIDRIKLTGENSVITPEINRSVYISEPDEALALLLRTTLELQGYEICETLDNQPGIVILDSEDDMSGLKGCKDLKANLNFVNTKIIVTSTVHDKSAILNAGADLYLPKPYEISDLIRWIEFFFK